MHAIVSGADPSRKNFEIIKTAIYEDAARKGAEPPAAAGVMFISGSSSVLPENVLSGGTIDMTPVVYVHDVNTTFYEGSCGSGTTAACAAMSLGCDDGDYVYDVRQPKGTIRCTCVVRDGEAKEIYIEGPVIISEEASITI